MDDVTSVLRFFVYAPSYLCPIFVTFGSQAFSLNQLSLLNVPEDAFQSLV